MNIRFVWVWALEVIACEQKKRFGKKEYSLIIIWL